MDDLQTKLKGKIPGPDTGIEIRKSVCAICDPGTQCGLDCYVKDGTIIKVEGSLTSPHSHGTLCSKGQSTRQYVYNAERILTPLRRTGQRGSGDFEPISWDEALDEIVTKLNKIKAEHGPESVAIYTGYTKWYRPYLQRFAYNFGTPNYMTESSTCNSARVVAQKLTLGANTAADLPKAQCLLVWSLNPGHAHTLRVKAFRTAIERGMKLIVVDPRVTWLAAQADIHLQLRPGTDGALALAMAHVIIAEDLYDHAFVENWTHGFDEFAKLAVDMAPARAAEITGVPADLIAAAARMYATTHPAGIWMSAAPVVHHVNGVQNYRAVSCLIGLTGNVDIVGGNRINKPSICEVAGNFPTRQAEFIGAGRLADMPPRVGQDRFPVWCKLIDQAQAMDLPRQILEGSPYPIHALLSFGMNHKMWPDSDGALAAFSKLDLVVDVDLFMTDSARWADIILPACSSVERREARCWPSSFVVFTQPVIAPLGQSKSDFDIIAELSARLGLGDDIIEGGYEHTMEWILEPAAECGVTVEALNAHPEGMKAPNPVANPEKKYERAGKFNTPTGKFEFLSTILETYADRPGYDALPVYREPATYTPEFPLNLCSGARLPYFQHTRTYRLPWTRSLCPEPRVDINPATAADMKIGDGDFLTVTTSHSHLSARAHCTQTVRPGDVHLYHDFPGANANSLIAPDYLDPISGFPGFKSVPCRIEASEPPSKSQSFAHYCDGDSAGVSASGEKGGAR